MSKTSSQLITAFVETRQNMELDADKHRFMEFQETIKSRGQKVKEKLGGAKEETILQSSYSASREVQDDGRP
jgi:glycosylphosphatidylinositol transamidase (GPIT) subunit GPI8